MNAIPWVMTQLLADQHRRDLQEVATRRRRATRDGKPRSGGHAFHRRGA